jgi:hypothetical protein
VFYSFLVQESKILKFLGFMWNPLSWVMEAAAIMAIAMAHGGRNMDGTVNLFLSLLRHTLYTHWTRLKHLWMNE